MVKISPQLKFWTGKFGQSYWRRNQLSPENIKIGVKAYRRIFDGIKVNSVLEVGSNIGNNLVIIRKLLGPKVKLYAVEPNQLALSILKKNQGLNLTNTFKTDAAHIPLADNSVDLTFTSGVLIHIAPDDLLSAATEIVRVAKKYVLCLEFFSHEPEEKPYRGRRNVFFKRDFGAFYLDHFPELRTVDYGFFWQRELPIFMNINWWLFRKIR